MREGVKTNKALIKSLILEEKVLKSIIIKKVK